jgi:hypothetical protein
MKYLFLISIIFILSTKLIINRGTIMKKLFLTLGLLFAVSINSYAACFTDSTITGTVHATIVGIEYRDNCTFLLLDNDFVSTLSNHDNNPFLAGRFTYLSLDPSNAEAYQSVLTLASMALATQTRIFAAFTSRTGRIDRFSLSTKSNSN